MPARISSQSKSFLDCRQSAEQPGLLEAGACARRPATKFFEDLHGVTAPPQRENGAPEAPPGLADCVGLFEARFAEGRERVGAQHLGPLVAVIASRVASGEDVREAAEEAIFGERWDDRILRGHTALQF